MKPETILEKIAMVNKEKKVEILLNEYSILKDKLRRRNMQIKDLKDKIGELQEELDRLAYLETDPNSLK